MHEQFLQSMVYEETSGLYYDYNSGYYYDANKKMYYDGQKEWYHMSQDHQFYTNHDLTPFSVSRALFSTKNYKSWGEVVTYR